MIRTFNLISILFLVIYLNSISGCNFFHPERPSTVSETAIYETDLIKGGAHWIDFPEKLNDSTYSCLIYGTDGELWSKREYILNLNCSNKSYSIEEIRDNFDIYGGGYVRIKTDNAQGFCDMILSKSTDYP